MLWGGKKGELKTTLHVTSSKEKSRERLAVTSSMSLDLVRLSLLILTSYFQIVTVTLTPSSSFPSASFTSRACEQPM